MYACMQECLWSVSNDCCYLSGYRLTWRQHRYRMTTSSCGTVGMIGEELGKNGEKGYQQKTIITVHNKYNGVGHIAIHTTSLYRILPAQVRWTGAKQIIPKRSRIYPRIKHFSLSHTGRQSQEVKDCIVNTTQQCLVNKYHIEKKEKKIH